jgi:riboflavin kinase/FMN adenylyltransferase
MTLDQELAKHSPPGLTALTIGTFDGVHRGHQELMRRLNVMASRKGLLPAVLTFRNHPRLVLNPAADLKYISTVEERIALLRRYGADQVFAVDFTKEVSLLRAREFVGLLCGRLKMKGLMVGPDFALGHNREGDIPTLRRLGAEMDFWVEPVEPVQAGTAVIGSSAVRSLLAQGAVESVGSMLGRPYSLTGTVVPGDRRGRLLGFPTANLSLPLDLALPCDGIYAAWAVVDGRRHQSATNVGVRPTFGAGRRIVEAFLLDFQGDLYGKRLTLEFVCRLREELSFPSADALVEQMALDVLQTRAVLARPVGALPGEAAADHLQKR